MTSHLQTPAGKPRARSLGVPFTGTPGEWNAITDVPGVEVGYRTLIEGESVRTGVTAIHPRGRDRSADPCAAGVFSLNGNGEMTGVSWVEESGTVAWPITITNTHAVGIAHEATIHWAVRRFTELGELWLLPVAAETYDGYLNDINGGHVTRQVVVDAIEASALGTDRGGLGRRRHRHELLRASRAARAPPRALSTWATAATRWARSCSATSESGRR